MSSRYEAERALLVVDMLRDFVEPDGALYIGDCGQEIIGQVADHLQAARQRGDLVVFICDRHRPDDAEFDMFPPHCIAGSPGAEIIEPLAPQEDDILIPKRRYSGFYATELDLTLREYGIQDVDIVGVCTNICVLYTAADARNRSYRVRVFADAVASMDEQAHRWALNQMETVLGCEVI